MGAYLDLGDVVSGHPMAEKELSELYAKIDQLNARLKPENREPPHCSTCSCGLPAEPTRCHCGKHEWETEYVSIEGSDKSLHYGDKPCLPARTAGE